VLEKTEAYRRFYHPSDARTLLPYVALRDSIPDMSIRVAAAVLILAFTAVAQTSPSSDKPAPANEQAAPSSQPALPLDPALFKVFGNYGGWWNRISEAEKDAFINGFMTAMARVNSVAVGVSEATMKEAKPGAANFNEKLYQAMDLRMLGKTFDFKLDKPLKPRLDEFYKDPLNVRIPVQYAMDYVRDEIAGKKTAGQLLDELNEWRKILNGGKN
jgi:hypothetical protein